MKFIFYTFIFCFLLPQISICFKNKGKAKAKVIIPSILFPDVIPFAPRFLLPSHNKNSKSMNKMEKDLNLSTNSNENLTNTMKPNDNNINQIALKNESMKTNENNNSLSSNENITNFKNETKEAKKNEHFGKNRSNHAYGSYHLLETMAYLQKETLMPQLIVCLCLFSIVVLVICGLQCFIQKKVNREKEIQRVLKMAMNENC